MWLKKRRKASKLPQLRDTASPYSNKQLILMLKRIGQMATRRSPSQIKRMLGRLQDPQVQAKARAYAELKKGVEPLGGEVHVTTTQLSSVIKKENPKSQAAKKKKLMLELMQTDKQNETEGREMDEKLREMRDSAVEDEQRRASEEPVQSSDLSYQEKIMMEEQLVREGCDQPRTKGTEEVQTQAPKEPNVERSTESKQAKDLQTSLKHNGEQVMTEQTRRELEKQYDVRIEDVDDEERQEKESNKNYVKDEGSEKVYHSNTNDLAGQEQIKQACP